MRLDGWKLAAIVVSILAITLTIFTLVTRVSYQIGVLNNKVDMDTERLKRIETAIDSGAICRGCVSLKSQSIMSN